MIEEQETVRRSGPGRLICNPGEAWQDNREEEFLTAPDFKTSLLVVIRPPCAECPPPGSWEGGQREDIATEWVSWRHESPLKAAET